MPSEWAHVRRIAYIGNTWSKNEIERGLAEIHEVCQLALMQKVPKHEGDVRKYPKGSQEC